MSYEPTPAVVEAALRHANDVQPMECCGVVLHDEYIPLDNKAIESGHFVMDQRALLRLNRKREVQAIVHSHVHYPAVAGDADKSLCESTGLPWLIISWPSGFYNVIEPCGFMAPLVGREWQWGSHDCYGLVRDAFQVYAGIKLEDYARGEWLFWQRGDDCICDRIAGSGFVQMPAGTALRHCDVFCMAVASSTVNHLAVFLEPDKILHQLYRQLSIRELYGGHWLKRTRVHLRHERLM